MYVIHNPHLILTVFFLISFTLQSDEMKIVYGRSPDFQKKAVTLARLKQKVVNPVSHFVQTLDDGKIVGYMKLGDFNSKAVPGLKEAITDMEVRSSRQYVEQQQRTNPNPNPTDMEVLTPLNS